MLPLAAKPRTCKVAMTFYPLFYLKYLAAVSLLIFTQAVLSEELIQVKVVEPYLNIHSGPAGGYPVIHVAAKGEWVTVLKRRTSWFKVSTSDDVQGWIKQDDLHLTESSQGSAVKLFDGSFTSFSQRDMEFGMLGGSFDGTPSLTLFADWIATENISAGLSLTQALGDLSENQYFLVNVQHTTFPDWRVSPYFSLGVGKIRTQPRANLVQSGDEARTSDLYAVGVGLRYYLARNFLVKLEYKNLQALTSRDENEEIEEWKLGFAVYF
ncbi:SH3 domain-containing protein [Paraglaciecola sp. 2405UD69-4]|uniref:SH3 domain-containing protein n=1 Tax=Paraglaciecola sp. 2405UD69-4 TaxID=3391836 RepID=UPI0039C9CEBA